MINHPFEKENLPHLIVIYLFRALVHGSH